MNAGSLMSQRINPVIAVLFGSMKNCRNPGNEKNGQVRFQAKNALYFNVVAAAKSKDSPKSGKSR